MHNTWFTSHVKRCINKKKRLYSKAKLSASDDDWQLYRSQAEVCKKEIKAAKDKFFNHDISAHLRSNTKKFWKVVNPKLSAKNIL